MLTMGVIFLSAMAIRDKYGGAYGWNHMFTSFFTLSRAGENGYKYRKKNKINH